MDVFDRVALSDFYKKRYDILAFDGEHKIIRRCWLYMSIVRWLRSLKPAILRRNMDCLMLSLWERG
ncbi:hypothetical protein Pan241w_06790 [Gimesia alba]|uniref:Uncharacterized protein n=1 Tax=Gimesia alba TaxID=2527973 RepID=A0A517R9T6_9PLAN|nr:hypothetical protein Pan241w_06790 [Gimesia alba]